MSQNITVCGWADSFRVQQSNGIAFISLNDGSCLTSLQIIIDPQNDEEREKLGSIYEDGTKGVSLQVYGKVVESPAKGQEIELKAKLLKF